VHKVKADPTIFTHLGDLFNRITKNSIIRGALYMWSDTSKFGIDQSTWGDSSPEAITNVFMDKAKDTDTMLIFDNYNDQYHAGTMGRFQETFGVKNIILDTRQESGDPKIRRNLAAAKAGINVGYMHDKFLLFTELEGIGKYVIVQMTANINLTQYFQFNNMLVLYDNPVLFGHYLEHWRNLKACITKRRMRRRANPIPTNDLQAINEYDMEDPSIFFYPRSNCPVAAELKAMIPDAKDIEIYVAMGYFTRGGMLGLLRKHKEGGAKIKLVLGDELQNYKTEEILKNDDFDFHVIKNQDYNSKRSYKVPCWEEGKFIDVPWDNWNGRMHHKYLLIKHKNRKITWTGSYNYTYPGLKLNDETVLRLEDENVFDQYKKEFDWLHQKKYTFKSVLM
jgi:HKD family nuclease